MTVFGKALRYGVVGALAFGVDFGVTWLCLKLMPLLVANTIGFVTANIFNFVVAHRWVFGGSWGGGGVFRSYVSVLAISTVGLVLNNLVVWLMVGLAAMPLLFGKVVATGLVMAWNFVARLVWTYKIDKKVIQ